MNGPFSPQLLVAMRRALDNKEQVILFQNRRGFAPMIECRECGWTPRCEACDVSLTFHKALGQLTCHYCGRTYAVPDVCPCCGSRDLRGRGYGTEKVEDKVMELFSGSPCGADGSRHDAHPQCLRAPDKRLLGASHRHTHRHADGKQRTGLRQGVCCRHTECRLHAQLSRLPGLTSTPSR